MNGLFESICSAYQRYLPRLPQVNFYFADETTFYPWMDVKTNLPLAHINEYFLNHIVKPLSSRLFEKYQDFKRFWLQIKILSMSKIFLAIFVCVFCSCPRWELIFPWIQWSFHQENAPWWNEHWWKTAMVIAWLPFLNNFLAIYQMEEWKVNR